MLKYIYIAGTILFVLSLVGCTNTENPNPSPNKKIVYKPMKITPAHHPIKSEPIIDINKDDVEKYRRDQGQMSDFEKHAHAVDRRLRK